MKKNASHLPLALFLLLHPLIAALAMWLYQPPRGLPESASPTQFSAGRAMAHVIKLASAPRPHGSTENARARDHLVTVLRDQLGLEVQRQTGTVSLTARGDRPGRLFDLENIFARLPGTEAGPGLLFVAHHDSVRSGPGAADDASSVAAILEALRAVRVRGEAPRRDILVLFTDGEEIDMLGARLFVRTYLSRHPVSAVFNFEARGTAGPVFMFETSGAARPLIDALAAASPLPVATSLSDFIYHRMPNDTDFTIFRHAGIPGMNFAFIDGAEHYHRDSDTPGNLDPRSLQHAGETILGLIERFAYGETLPTARTTASSAVYFNLIGPVLVRYPAWLAPFLSSALAVALIVFGFRAYRGQAGYRVLGGTAIAGAIAVVGGVIGLAAVWLGFRLGQGHGGLAPGFWAGVVVIATTAALAQRRFGTETGPALLLVAVAAISGFLLPAGSYLFQWPALFAGASLFCRSPRQDRLLAASSLAATLIHAPTLYYLFIAMPVAAPVLAALVALTSSVIAAGTSARASRKM